MLKRIENLPAGVIGVEASGTVTAQDYRDVLIPLIGSAREDAGDLRFLYVCGEVDVTAGAAWEDARAGLSNWAAFEKIAVVTDQSWIEHSVNALGWIMPGEVKTFRDADRDHAVDWLVQD